MTWSDGDKTAMVHAIQGNDYLLPQCSVLMQSDSMRPSDRAPHSYSHTCPHLKSAAHMCSYKETHVHTPTHILFLRLTSPLWVGAITQGRPTHLNVPKAEDSEDLSRLRSGRLRSENVLCLRRIVHLFSWFHVA